MQGPKSMGLIAQKTRVLKNRNDHKFSGIQDGKSRRERTLSHSQCFGSVLISLHTGSSILGQYGSRYGSRFFHDKMNNNFEKFLKFFMLHVCIKSL